MQQKESYIWPWSYRTSLIGVILIALYFFGKEAMPYLSGLLGTITFYLLMRGQMIYLTEKKHWAPRWAVILILFEVLLFFLIPLIGIVMMLIDLFSTVHIDFSHIETRISELNTLSESYLGFKVIDLGGNMKEEITTLLTSLVQNLAGGVYSTVINSIVILFLLYFILKEYKAFEALVYDLLPFTKEHRTLIAKETIRLTMSNALGIPLMAFLQGVLAYLGYLFFGIENPIFFAVLTAFSTIIPILGTMIVWIPLTISLFYGGAIGSGMGLLIYGFFIVGGVDNLARFILQKKMADTHPLITVFGVIFGISIFGFWGVIFGPLLLSLLSLLIGIFRKEFIHREESSVLEAKNNQ